MFSVLAQSASRLFRQGSPLSSHVTAIRISLGARHYSVTAPHAPPASQPPLSPPSANPRQDPTWSSLMDSFPDPEARSGSRQTPHETWAMNHAELATRVSVPANAYSGRTVYVSRDGFGEAYKRLEIILSRNKVKATVRMQERHEKKGVKRRRLSSERWRKQFANEVRKKVQLVKEIRNRGA